MAAQQLFGLHGQKIAIQHGGGLDDGLGQADGRQLHRKAARLQHPALDVIHALLEVCVALIDIAPGIHDGNDGLAFPVLGAVAHLHETRTMAHGAHVVGPEPAGAAQLVGGKATGTSGTGGSTHAGNLLEEEHEFMKRTTARW